MNHIIMNHNWNVPIKTSQNGYKQRYKYTGGEKQCGLVYGWQYSIMSSCTVS